MKILAMASRVILFRDLLEGLIVIALGAMTLSAIRSVSKGHIRVSLCPSCHRPTSRAYPLCRHCGRQLPS